MVGYFPEPKYLVRSVRVELDLSNYAAKTELRDATDVNMSKFAKKVDSAILKLTVDKLDIDKLKNARIGLGN